MSIETVKLFFKEFGLDNNIKEFDVSSATVEEAAKALNVEEGRIAKTLSFKRKDGGCMIVVTTGDVKINNTKFKQAFSMKASLMPAAEVAEIVGHVIGGVCPFVIPEEIPIYLDESLKKYTTIFPACGSRNSAIELTWQELAKYAKTDKWVDVTVDK
ncbi:MAG: YbaK/EbsC family protein [Fusobacteriaceae bacterium]|nr:YbaK/EbsC family protein [Fusobacteriaceae bacterium]